MSCLHWTRPMAKAKLPTELEFFAMRPLPIRPARFVPAYIALLVLSFVAPFGGGQLLNFIGGAPLIAAQALTLFWVWQALAFATDRLSAHGESASGTRTLQVGRALLCISLVGLIGLFVATPRGVLNSGAATAPLAIALLATSLGAFGLFWAAASAMCATERATGQGSPHVLGTFIQFIYLIFAVGFLYNRLRLVEAVPVRS